MKNIFIPNNVNFVTLGINKMVECMVKIFQQILLNFKRLFDQFVETRHYRVNGTLTLWAPTPQNGKTHSNNSSAVAFSEVLQRGMERISS